MSATAQRGFAMAEALVAVAIVGVIAAGAMVMAGEGKKSLKAMEHAQGADALELGLTPLFQRQDVIAWSAARAPGAGALARCLEGRGLCRDGAAHELALHLPNSATAITGKKVGYDGGGAVCPKGAKRCAKYRFETEVLTFCGAGAACTGPAHVAVRWRLVSAAGKTVRKGVAERVIPAEQVIKAFAATCREGAILRGIGMSGEPLCTPLAKVRFADADGALSDGTMKVTPVDCRKHKRGPKDQWYVQKITEEGVVQCAPRTW